MKVKELVKLLQELENQEAEIFYYEPDLMEYEELKVIEDKEYNCYLISVE